MYLVSINNYVGYHGDLNSGGMAAMATVTADLETLSLEVSPLCKVELTSKFMVVCISNFAISIEYIRRDQFLCCFIIFTL